MTTARRRWRTPQVLVAVAAAALTVALVRDAARLGEPPYAVAFGLTLVYLGWLLAEAPVTYASRDGDAPNDRTLLPYGLARFATAIAAAWGPLPWTRWAWWMVVTAVVFVGGIALRLLGVRALGDFYSHRVARQLGHRVVTTGPYAVLRHPAYAGMLIAHVGFVAFFANPGSATCLVLLAAAIAWRIRVEERMLFTLPGYAGYAAGTARLIPGVW